MKNKNTIISVIIVAIVFIGIIWFAKPNGNKEKANAVSDKPSSAAALTAAETFYNFGEVSMANGNVNHEFKVKNNAAGPINVAKIYTSCMCTTASITVGEKTKGPFGMPGHGLVPKANMEIPAGAEAVITAIFDPNAHGPAGVGRIEREIYLEDDAGAQTILKFEATVTP